MLDPKNIENRTNKTFPFCGRYPTIMDGIVYRHVRGMPTNYRDGEVSSSRNGVTVDDVFTLHDREQIDDLIDAIEKAWEEHMILKAGNELPREVANENAE